METSLQFEIPSELCETRDVQERILQEVCHCHFDTEGAFAIKLALEEALINAIKHGNRFKPEKKVRVRARIAPEQAEIVVEDEGDGFIRSAVPDPTAEENLERLHGRGILLIEAYMDEVQWMNGGRSVRMVRRNRLVGAGK